MAPWTVFGEQVLKMVKAVSMVTKGHSRLRPVGHGWAEPKDSPTLAAVEEIVKVHIQRKAGPDYHLPCGWAFRTCLEDPDLCDALTTLYVEIMKGDTKGTHTFHQELLLQCVVTRMAWTPRLAMCKEALVGIAMGFEAGPNRTTYKMVCAKFIDYLKAPTTTTMPPPPPPLLEPSFLPFQFPPLPPLPPSVLAPSPPEPMLEVVATLIGPPLSPAGMSDANAAMMVMEEMEASGELDELVAALPPLPPPSPADECSAVIDEMEACEAFELAVSLMCDYNDA